MPTQKQTPYKDVRSKRIKRRNTSEQKPSFRKIFSKGSLKLNLSKRLKSKRINIEGKKKPRLTKQSSSFVENIRLIAIGKTRTTNSGRELVKSSRRFQLDLSMEEIMERYKLTKTELLEYINKEREKTTAFGK